MDKHLLVDIHIWLMLYVWLLAVPAAIGIAVWGRSKNKPWWPKAHMGIMGIGVTIPMTIAAAVGIVATEGFKAKPHMIVGTVVVFGAWCQIVLGMVNHTIFLKRGRGKDEPRPWHNSLHIWLGRILLVLALVNIPLGMAMHRSGTSWFVTYTIWVALGCVGSVLLFRMAMRAKEQRLASENAVDNGTYAKTINE
ncbi:hypothetical protein BX666DRAFT_2025074 [Dichotomocladium elegans]|nr:hypothetical protein BX666DRAFT_2025074 [Dichotomocladium elegans]